MEFVGFIIATVLTLMVFSYITGDNPLFKLASHIFVGVSIGYAIIVTVQSVFLPALNSGNLVTVLPAIILCFLLIFRIRPTQSDSINALSGITMAFVLGVGSALAIGGGLFGTLIPQLTDTMSISLNPFASQYQTEQAELGIVNWLNNLIILLGTVGTLAYFTFAVRYNGPLSTVREGIVRFWAGIGRLMIVFTLGVLFANTFSARVAVLISRLEFLTRWFN